MQTAKRLEGIGEYYFSQKLREIDTLNKAGRNIINLGIGSPDLPPHPEVIKVLQEEAAKPNVHAYQNYKGSPVLRNAVSDWYRQWYHTTLDPETEILPLIGSKEGIMHVCMTYINENDIVLVPDPGYPTYSAAAKICGAQILSYALEESRNWQPDFNAIEDDLKGRKAKLMFVNYPHMPTGQLATTGLFADLIAFAKRNDILIVHDNPYSFILNEQPESMLAVEGASGRVLELNSLSKSHNMAGWRVGVLCGAKEHIDNVLKFKSNMDSGMFLPIQLAAAKALSMDKEWYDSLNGIYKERRQIVFELLDTLQCNYNKRQVGMFVWAGIPEGYKDAYALSDELLYNKNVFLTPGGIFGTTGNNYVRISLCAPKERFEEAIARIKQL